MKKWECGRVECKKTGRLFMSSKPKKKLCWNCEGNVTAKADSCPYCGVSLNVAAMQMTEDPLAPPYKMMGSVTDQSIPHAPYAKQDTSDTLGKSDLPTAEGETNDVRTISIALTALLFGTVFVLFGLLLFLFSDNNGIFTLRWHTHFWFIYLLLGLPLLYLGWKMSGQVQDDR